MTLYEWAIQEERYFLSEHHKRVAFFAGLLSAIAAGTIAGVLNATHWVHLAALTFGPALVTLVALVAIGGTSRYYQRFLEAIVQKAKLERRLGLTEPQHPAPSPVPDQWQAEAYVSSRHLRFRKLDQPSERFVEYRLRYGYHGWTVAFFSLFLAVAAIGEAGLVWLLLHDPFAAVTPHDPFTAATPRG